jgi:hypothetical protein
VCEGIVEAILLREEFLSSFRSLPHYVRFFCLNTLVTLLQMRFDATGQEEDLARIVSLKTEANQLSTT